jgi:hypothetical protein
MAVAPMKTNKLTNFCCTKNKFNSMQNVDAITINNVVFDWSTLKNAYVGHSGSMELISVDGKTAVPASVADQIDWGDIETNEQSMESIRRQAEAWAYNYSVEKSKKKTQMLHLLGVCVAAVMIAGTIAVIIAIIGSFGTLAAAVRAAMSEAGYWIAFGLVGLCVLLSMVYFMPYLWQLAISSWQRSDPAYQYDEQQPAQSAEPKGNGINISITQGNASPAQTYINNPHV